MDICICFAGNVACSCKRLPAEQTTSDAFDEGSQSEGCALGDRTPDIVCFYVDYFDKTKWSIGRDAATSLPFYLPRLILKTFPFLSIFIRPFASKMRRIGSIDSSRPTLNPKR